MPIQRKIRAYVDIPTHIGPPVTQALTIANISLTGCFLRTDVWLDIGTALTIYIPLKSPSVLELRGRVVRHHEEPNGYGISFEGIVEDVEKELAILIAKTVE